MAKLSQAEWNNLKAISAQVLDENRSWYLQVRNLAFQVRDSNTPFEDSNADLKFLREWCRFVLGLSASTPPGAQPVPTSPTPSQQPSSSPGDTGKDEVKPVNFARVLEATTSTLVDAQKKLDDKASQYAATALFPTSYRIPKATLAFRYELKNNEKTGFDLLFVSYNNTTTERNQQSLELDVVAVPPSPEFLAELALRRSRIGLLRDPVLRALILKQATLVPPSIDQKRIIVLGAPAHVGTQGLLAQDFYVMAAVIKGMGAVDVQYGVQLVTDRAGKMEASESLRPWGSATGADVNLAKKMAEWCDQQAKDS